MSETWLLWDKSHIKHDYALAKAKELRESGKYKSVRVGYTITDRDVNGDLSKFSKIYLERCPKCYSTKRVCCAD